MLVSATCLIGYAPVNAQKGTTSFGIHFKPVFPLGLVNTDGQTARDQSSTANLDVRSRGGYSFGGLLRFGLSERFAIESGINLIMRRYQYELNYNDTSHASSDHRFRGYEIPINTLVFIRLSRNMYMNVQGGISMDLFPTGGVATYDRDTVEFGLLERNWFQIGVNAGLGYEYRTEKSGTLYIGAYYHLPVQDIGTIFISEVPYFSSDDRLIHPEPTIRGAYLTIDIRYYFQAGEKLKKKGK